MATNQIETVVDGEYEALRGRVADYMRVFNLPHQSYRYPIRGNLKGVMNVIPQVDKSMNVVVISIPNNESWNRIKSREGKMYNALVVDVHLTDQDRQGEIVQAYMFIGRLDRINQNVYPLPEYYKIVRDGAQELGEVFLSEYLETTYMQANGAFLSLKTYEENMAPGRRPDDFISMTGTTANICRNSHKVPFEAALQQEGLNFKRDYYLEEQAKNIILNDTSNKMYQFIFLFQKYEFYRGSLGFERVLGDQSVWSGYERGIDMTRAFDIFWDVREGVPFDAMQPVKIVIDRTILKNPSLVVQTIAQIILGFINPMTLQPWDSGATIQMLWRHYMEGLLNTAMSLERHTSDINLIEPEYVTEWEPGDGTAMYDTFLPNFNALTLIDNEMIARRELVQFPVQLPRDYEQDYREANNKGDYWKQWMWFYSKFDRVSENLFTFAKFEESLDEKAFIQVLMSNVKNRIKYKRRVLGDDHAVNYIMTGLRNYSTNAEIPLVSQIIDEEQYDDLDLVVEAESTEEE